MQALFAEVPVEDAMIRSVKPIEVLKNHYTLMIT